MTDSERLAAVRAVIARHVVKVAGKLGEASLHMQVVEVMDMLA